MTKESLTANPQRVAAIARALAAKEVPHPDPAAAKPLASGASSSTGRSAIFNSGPRVAAGHGSIQPPARAGYVAGDQAQPQTVAQMNLEACDAQTVMRILQGSFTGGVRVANFSSGEVRTGPIPGSFASGALDQRTGGEG